MWENTLCHAHHYMKKSYETSNKHHHNTQTTLVIGPRKGSRGVVTTCASTNSVVRKTFKKLAKRSYNTKS